MLQLGVRRLDRFQFLEQLVVFGIGDLRCIKHVVVVRMLLQQRPQLDGPVRRFRLAHLTPKLKPWSRQLNRRRAAGEPAARSRA